MSKKKFTLVTSYPIKKYKCGLKSGDRVILKKDLIIRDQRNRPTGFVHKAGEIWTVLPGSKQPPIDVWFRRPDGERHTWTDEPEIFDWFDKVTSSKTFNNPST